MLNLDTLITYNYIIPAYGHAKLTEHLAQEAAERLFAAHGKWAIKSSDAFVTLFFFCQDDVLAFNASWLTQALASPCFPKSRTPHVRVQEHVINAGATQPMALPDVPMAPLTEYLRLGQKGGMGWDRICRWEVYAPGEFRDNTYKTDPRSEFTSRVEYGHILNFQWNAATVVHEGSSRTMLWTRDRNGSRNEAAIDLLRHQFVQGSGLLSCHDAAFGDAYFLLNQTWKPYIDIVGADKLSVSAFRKAALQHISGWWHAVPIENGWRIFSDNLTELTWAKLALSS